MTKVAMIKLAGKGMWVLVAASLVAGTMATVFTSRAWAAFGIEKFENSISMNLEGTLATQAGSHPYSMTTLIVFDHHANGREQVLPDGDPKNIEVNLPPGLMVNPTATPVKCTEGELESGACPDASAVGVETIYDGSYGAEAREQAAVYNIVTPPGVPAEFGFVPVANVPAIVHIMGKARTGSDYGLSAEISDVSQLVGIYASTVTLWGDPSDSSHDKERGKCATSNQQAEKEERETGEPQERHACPVEAGDKPFFLTLPSSCMGGELTATISADSWQEPEPFVSASWSSPAMTGCEKLDFSPSLIVQADTSVTESPSGLSVELRVPQEEAPTGLVEASLREAVVTLPAGMTVSPSAANGRVACTPGEIALGNPQPPSCPDASKLGSVQIKTPLLEDPLEGSMYLAQQGNAGLVQGSNPFGSLLALYLVAEGSGIVVKLPGKVNLDPVTGQVTAQFGEDPITTLTTGDKQFLPEVPFSKLSMQFFGGPRAPLVTPSGCGMYKTTSQLTPYNRGTPAEPSSSFTIDSGCGAQVFAPSFTAGTTSNQAGAYSPFTVKLSRQDGEGRLAGVQVRMPPGLLGVLRSVMQCPEPQASLGKCGSDSLIGHATAAAGPGADPVWVDGSIYLTGPYRGAPFGLSIVVPAVAGPFNLGDLVVRAPIAVDSHTAQLTVTTDSSGLYAIPTILQGIPLYLRTISVSIDRSRFMFNPTDCAPLTVASTAVSTAGASATASSPFRSAACGLLPFKPSFKVSTVGKPGPKSNGASLQAKVAAKEGPGASGGEANIAKVNVQLPKLLPARLTTLQKACKATQFSANPAGCPSASVVGTAVVHSPLLNNPLTGPAFVVSHGSAAFPDIEFVLQGEGITFVLDGETEIKQGITYSKFETVPDVPISSFETRLPDGPYSLLALPSGSLCGKNLVMPTTITSQNGAVVKQSTKITVTGCPHAKKRRKAKRDTTSRTSHRNGKERK